MKTENRELVIIGSGLAGLRAACAAKNLGADVLVLEKMKTYGGNSVLAGGGFACWKSKLGLNEKDKAGPDSWQRQMNETIASGRGACVPELVETMVKGAPEGLDWLIDLGVEFRDSLAHHGGWSRAGSYLTKGTGKDFMDIVKKAALDAGVEIRTECRVTELLCEAARDVSDSPASSQNPVRVTGVKCEYKGDPLEIKASKGVILAAGGFAAGSEMLEKYAGLGAYKNCTNHPGATGEMIAAAEALGAKLINMEYVQLFPTAHPVTGMLDKWALSAYSSAGMDAIYINSEGRRFVNELEGRDVVSNAQTGGCSCPTWALITADMAERLQLTEKDIRLAVKSGRIIYSEDLEGIAAGIGCDPKALKETAAAAAAGTDQNGRFGTDHKDSYEKGPFMAISQWPSVHFTMGGILTDTKARVIDKNGSVIPGLYAAGEICGGVHGASRLAGNALTECLVFGKTAGETAAGRA